MPDAEVEGALSKLYQHYQTANRLKFESALPRDYRIGFNPLLRRLTGRITYGWRLIEISRFHFLHYGYDDAIRTLEHEMLHLYLHTQGKPSGHNGQFKELAKRLDIRVFHANPYPRNRATRHRYLYECPVCRRMVFRKRPQERHALACGDCCRQLAGGAWDSRFKLRLIEKVRFA